MIKTSFKQKLLLIFSGICLAIILLEIFLQVMGFAFLTMKRIKNRQALTQKDRYKIVCLGDSMTAFGGKESYPAQLQTILNGKDLGLKFAVINEGIPGNTSFAVVGRLEEVINRYQPDMIVVMMGINDDFLTVGEEIPPQTIFHRIKKRLKIFKLSVLLKKHVAAKWAEWVEVNAKKTLKNEERQGDHGREEYSEDQAFFDRAMEKKILGQFEEERKVLVSLLQQYPDDEILNVELGFAQRRLERFPEAIKTYYHVLEINKNNTRAYFSLGEIYYTMGQWDKAIPLLEKGLSIDASDKWAYYLLALSHEDKGDYVKVAEVCKQALIYHPNVRWFQDRFDGLKARGQIIEAQQGIPIEEKERKHFYSSAIGANYHKVKQITHQNGIHFVCVQYPIRSIVPLKWMMEGDEDVVFVDNEDLFKEAVKRESYGKIFEDAFAGDFGHCSAKGNRLLAQNISERIIEKIFNQ